MNIPRLHHLVAAAALLAAGSAMSAGPAGPAVPGVDPRIDDRMIVHMAPGADVATFIAAFLANNPELEGLTGPEESIPSRPVHLLALLLPPGYDEVLMDQLETDLELSYPDLLVSGDFLYENQAPEGKSGSTWLDGVAPAGFPLQYGTTLIGTGAAHARSTGLGTVVAVLDTGVDASHPELADRVLPFGFDFVDGDADPADTPDFADNDDDGDVDEMTGHGTFVAGLVALVAPEASILPVRVLDSDGVGDEWALTQGLYYAIDRGVEVINLSLGSTYDTDAVREAIAEAAGLGIVVVASAGNFDRADPREYPAMDDAVVPGVPPEPPTVITGAFGVAATDHLDVKADFSNYSERLVLSAPGNTADGPVDPALSIISTRPGGGYATWEGTSFATAFVSAAAALVRSQHPEWPANLDTYLAIESVLRGTAEDIYPQNPTHAADQALGTGRLDAAAAVAAGPVAPTTPGDLDNDGTVDVFDLITLLIAWGSVHSSADLDGDGVVNVFDLLTLLASFG